MIVLLNDDLMWAVPYATFLRSRFFGRRPPAAGFAIRLVRSSTVPGSLLACFLPAGDCLLRALARARVGAGPLTVDGKAPPVADALVTADLDLALDVGCDLAAQVTFDLEVGV